MLHIPKGLFWYNTDSQRSLFLKPYFPLLGYERSHVRHEMHLIYKLTLSTYMALMNIFPMFNSFRGILQGGGWGEGGGGDFPSINPKFPPNLKIAKFWGGAIPPKWGKESIEYHY
jgi:hypothetical protein